MRSEFKITLVYVLFGILWIILTDVGLLLFGAGISQVTALQTAKGSVYVILSGLLIFLLAKRYLDQRRSRERERHEVFQSTLGASNHILRNYLNQMNLVAMEAREHGDFDRTVLNLAEMASAKATRQLDELGRLERYSVEDLQRLAYEENGNKT